MSEDHVLQIEEAGGIARVTLNRPHRLNALNPALATALREYFQGLQRRLATRSAPRP
jgi:enoyl-CoA hydratase/carnithine racemase